MKKNACFASFFLFALTLSAQQRMAVPVSERMKTAPQYNFSNLRICIDRKKDVNLPERKEPAWKKLPWINADGSLQKTATLNQGLTALTDKMWTAGDTITVGFYKSETTDLYINKVKKYASEWQNYGNIKFLFVDDVNKAEVKVGFQSGGSWSWIGRDVLSNANNERTMNFGWLNENTSEIDIRSVILHEFGHALGWLHEHQSPTANIPWDKDKVYAYFGGDPNNWSHAVVDHNIFETYSKSETNYSAYDKYSIMHYFFPKELTTNQMVFYQNNQFSPTDLRYAKIFYPWPVGPKGTLHTGDDCDAIDFSIEYDVIDKTLVEFDLDPGVDPTGNKITWWKQVSIPVIGNGQVNLEMQDGRNDKKTFYIGIIDKTREISFAKAKFLGVHTGLGYKWDLLPAVTGGCRVKLVWKNDKCH